MEITPFYIGQRVVAVRNVGRIRKGQTYTVTHMDTQCNCGIGVNVDALPIIIGGEKISSGEVVVCGICRCDLISNGLSYYFPHNFAPIQQTKYPLMTFEKIKESSPEILIPN